MKNRRFRYLITVISFVTLGYMFSGGDCGTDTDDPPPVTSVAAPTNVRVVLDQASSSFATVRWDHSPNQGEGYFAGYRVITYEVDTAGTPISVFGQGEINVPAASNSQAINSIVPMRRYQTFVTAVANNGVRSDSVGSIVYAAVFASEGKIDEYQLTGTAQSGFGWETFFGIGTQHPYTAGNAGSIDLHLRSATTGGQLNFYSPNLQAPGTRMTAFGLIGAGQDAFDQSQLDEPTSTSIAVVDNNVYLLKLESGHYVKIWVKSTTSAGGFRTVNFDYKLQPIQGLRVLKR
jgi:hypothetical protein